MSSRLVWALGAPGGSAWVQENGCNALINLAANSGSHTKHIRDASAIPTTKVAQRAHGGTAAAEQARKLLGML